MRIIKELLTLAAFCVCLLPELRALDAGVAQLKTFGTSGKEQTALAVDKETTLFSYHGKGCLTHLWFGGQFKNAAYTRIRIYVDDETAASIDTELYLAAGIGFGDETAPWGSDKMGKMGGGANIYDNFRIPFGRNVRVTGQLAPGSDEHPLFWWIVRGTENLPVQVAGVTLPDTARLKLYRRDKYTAQPLEEFPLCEVTGAGALYEVTVAAKAVHVSGSWKDNSFMEGGMRAYLDGADHPLMLSSGFEDYFLGSYYFDKGRYANSVAGVTHLDPKAAEVSAYRFHDTDPVFFQRGLKLTARCGEQIDGKTVGDPPATVYTTYTWLYQW